jgi:hypothetical protein
MGASNKFQLISDRYSILAMAAIHMSGFASEAGKTGREFARDIRDYASKGRSY